MTQGKKINVLGAGGDSIPTVGVTTFTTQLTPTLELDLAGVLVCEGSFYQGLIGGDMLSGKQDILGAATIKMPSAGDTGHIMWK